MTEILITGLTAGVQNRAAHEQMKPEALYYATDITTDVFGSVVCRNHHEVNSYFNTQVFTDPVKDIYQVDVEGTNKRLLYYRVANVLYCFNSYTGATRTVNSAMTGSHVSYAAFKPAASTYTYIYITDGITMLADNGSASITWGISAPEGVPFIRYTTGGNLTAGSYRYRYSFYDATTGSESNASIACAALTATANQATEISNIQASINSRVTSRRIYRTLVNGGSYYLVATIPDNVLTEFTDTQADSALATLLTEDQGVPPTGKIVRTYKNYLMLAGLSNYPNRVHFCIANLPDNFPETYYIEAGSSDDVVLNMIEWGGRMYFIQTASISGLDGTNADTFDVAGTRSDTGTAASQSPAAASDGIYFLGFDGVYRFDGAKSVKISEAIERAFGRTPSGLYEIVEYPQVESSTRAVVYQGKYYIVLPMRDTTGTITKRLWSYDIAEQRWLQYSIPAYDLFADAGRGELYASLDKYAAAGNYMVYNLFSSASSAVDAPAPRFVTKAFTLVEPEAYSLSGTGLAKRASTTAIGWIRKFRVDGAGSWTFAFYLDSRKVYEITLSGLSASNRSLWRRLPDKLKGSFLYLDVTYSGTAQPSTHSIKEIEVR